MYVLLLQAIRIITTCELQVNTDALVRKRRDDETNDDDEFDIPRRVFRNATQLQNAGIFRYGENILIDR